MVIPHGPHSAFDIEIGINATYYREKVNIGQSLVTLNSH